MRPRDSRAGSTGPFGSATASGLYGLLRAWYIPYLLIPDPERAARYQQRFNRTHAFLPARNGIRPDTLHVSFHAVYLVLVALLVKITIVG